MREKTLTISDELIEGLTELIRKRGVKIIIENEQELRRLGIDPKKAERVLEQWLLAELSAHILRIGEDDVR